MSFRELTVVLRYGVSVGRARAGVIDLASLHARSLVYSSQGLAVRLVAPSGSCGADLLVASSIEPGDGVTDAAGQGLRGEDQES